MSKVFEEELAKLNKAQKEAVEAIEGPVMVVAGPGTGKTQILALRIGNILKNTDTSAEGVLCLTFTNSAVRAMRERLRQYIGPEASKVKIATFHSFGMNMVEKFYTALGLTQAPKLLDEKDSVALCDTLLQSKDWQYIKPRSDTARYFKDLRNLITLLKRERITPKEFFSQIEKEIHSIEDDPGSISSRGPTKGSLKKDAQNKISGLERTREAVEFYDMYESAKSEQGLLDYDDILESLVNIVEVSEEAKSEIKENFLYVLVDEHQDSSGIQNKFLQVVWQDTENPNIFVVGDDRQLIYGFGGASLEYFENFKHSFGQAKLITLTENYRSTQRLLDASHNLLESSLTSGKLKSNQSEDHPIKLVEADYPRDEIIATGLAIQEFIKDKKRINLNEIAILVPRNYQVRSAIAVLKDMGLTVASGEAQDFFESREARSFLRVLEVVNDPENSIALARSFFDELSGISPIDAHRFLRDQNMREFSLVDLSEMQSDLFSKTKPVNLWLTKLKSWLEVKNKLSLYSLVQKVGAELLLESAQTHEELVMRIEVVRTMLHLLLYQVEKSSDLQLKDFLLFLNRLESYREHIPLAVFGREEGVKVLTLHGSKGLEFDFVWIAHMDSKSLGGSSRNKFTLPESIKDRIQKEDELVLRRQLYVAMTRAKRFCTISYARHSYTGGDQELSPIVLELNEHFEKQTAEETEKRVLSHDPKSYVKQQHSTEDSVKLSKLKKILSKEYEEKKISVSLLNNFFECPWKWYFRNFLQLPEPKSRSLELGNTVHQAIDKILQLGRKPSKKEIEDFVNSDTEALDIVSKWAKSSLPNVAPNFKSEQSIQVIDERFSNLSIYGRLDLIEFLSGKEIKITDFKTGRPRTKNEIQKTNEENRPSNLARQLAMYAYLIEVSPKWQSEVKEVVLEFLEAKNEKDRYYRSKVDKEEIDLIVRDIKDYSKALKSGDWTIRECNYNPYGGAKKECPYCKMAEIYR